MIPANNNFYYTIGDISFLVMITRYGIKEFAIDVEDLARVKSLYWCFKHKKDGEGYAHAKIGNASSGYSSNILLHRFITSFQYEVVDHINSNRFDNRKANLRQATLVQNRANTVLKDFHGVSKSGTKFRARTLVDNKRISLGTFTTKEEAAIAYKTYHSKTHKQYSKETK